MIVAAFLVCAVVGLGLLYAWALVQSRNGRTRVTMHADAHARPAHAAQLFPAWLVQAGRRTRLAAILFDETFAPHPLLLNGHAQTSELRFSKITGKFLWKLV
jgi:hypothetical protein